jgi:hypothetical protein
LGAEGVDGLQRRDQEPKFKAVTAIAFGFDGAFAIEKEVAAQPGWGMST